MSDIRILVLQRGWVVVGRYSETAEECILNDAAVIRRWGTTKGLGELTGGPTNKTVLDMCGEVRTARLAVIMQIICDAKAWEGVL